jgi:hypothetical protein
VNVRRVMEALPAALGTPCPQGVHRSLHPGEQNGVIKRFLRSFEEERVWQHKFTSFDQARAATGTWIARYNERRPHQSLHSLTCDCVACRLVTNQMPPPSAVLQAHPMPEMGAR